MNRKYLAAGILAAAALTLTACGDDAPAATTTPAAAPAATVAPAVQQSPADTFTGRIHAAGFPDTPDLDESAIKSARANCDVLDAGGTVPMVARIVSEGLDGVASTEQQAVFLLAGIASYCPEYVPDVTRWAAS